MLKEEADDTAVFTRDPLTAGALADDPSQHPAPTTASDATHLSLQQIPFDQLFPCKSVLISAF